MVGSLVPSSSIRRRMISMDCSTALPASASMAASTKLMRSPASPSLFTVMSEPPVVPASGVPRAVRRAVAAALRRAGSVILSVISPPCSRRSENAMRSAVRVTRVSSTVLTSRSARRASVSTSSRRCDPPWRSSPRFSCWRGKNAGMEARVCCGSRFGTEKRTPKIAARTTAMIFQRDKVIMRRGRPYAGAGSVRTWNRWPARVHPGRGPPKSWSGSP